MNSEFIFNLMSPEYLGTSQKFIIHNRFSHKILLSTPENWPECKTSFIRPYDSFCPLTILVNEFEVPIFINTIFIPYSAIQFLAPLMR